ncbi:lipocalin-like domain-containing protein [Paracraurococcus lichenis]|uniref:Lipocalin-like domain-containing protein n=1 Tax=Paracraurococcus lichenis TaxID=3064888 RepID=A0ABT9EBE6_9PROT|nr:lipocalin-like domain-containing protein [Paracraurococcus sp. LOR1-02]MDO9713533.1 lipocalin-like domain-containing protein [Paracraurococcus sp. LOR1-02]
MQDRLIGIWRLLEVRARDAEGRPIESAEFGPAPIGTVQFGEERMMAALGDSRPPAAGGTRFWVAYTGPWRFDGAVLSTRVDAAHPANRIGTDQVRQVRWEGERVVLTPPPRLVRGVMNHLELVWEKVA